MRRHDNLQFACGARIAYARFMGILRLLVKKTQHRRLKLRMQVCLWLFDKEEREVCVVHFLQLDSDCRHVEKVRVPMTGIAQIFRLDAVIGEFEPQVPSDIDQFLVVRKPERCRLTADTGGQGTKANLDRSADPPENLGANIPSK